MAEKQVHIKQAKHNENLCRELVVHPMDYKDWALTTVFYVAIHYAEAALATKGEHIKGGGGHGKREVLCKEHFRNIVKDLKELRRISEQVRYLILSPEKVGSDYYEEETVRECIETLENIKYKLSTKLS